jgi:hypothetical protein
MVYRTTAKQDTLIDAFNQCSEVLTEYYRDVIKPATANPAGPKSESSALTTDDLQQYINYHNSLAELGKHLTNYELASLIRGYWRNTRNDNAKSLSDVIQMATTEVEP